MFQKVVGRRPVEFQKVKFQKAARTIRKDSENNQEGLR
jgi:hypothetical protein